MAVSKVAFGQNVLIDLTSDSVTASDLRSGITAHNAAGQTITGTLQVVTYYTGTSDPSSSTGQNGDIYLKVVT